MPLYKDGLAEMIGAVRMYKPNESPANIQNWLNWRMRNIIDRRPYWAGLISKGVVALPAAYTTGTISLTNGSATVTGSSTAWPIVDIVNTTIAAAVTTTGIQTVTPASMSGITEDSYLYVDGAGNPEAIAVKSTTATTFTAVFTRTHTAGFAITQSSLAGRQLKVTTTTPRFTILYVTSGTSLVLDNPWSTTAVSDSSYVINLAYLTLQPNVKEILFAVDPVQGRPLRLHYPIEMLNRRDPQRTAVNSPALLADIGPNINGNMQYEIYPPSNTARQIYYQYYKQWPDMKNPADQPPPFIDPAVIVAGAIADALRHRAERDDPFYDPASARMWDEKFERGVAAVELADNSKSMQDYTWSMGGIGGINDDYRQSHAFDSDGMPLDILW